MTPLTSHWLFRDVACPSLVLASKLPGPNHSPVLNITQYIWTPRSVILCLLGPSRYVLLFIYCCAYSIIQWSPVHSILTYTQTPCSVILWPLPVTRTRYTDSSLFMVVLTASFCSPFFVLTFCAYGQLIPPFNGHFSYLQCQWTSLFSLILLRILLWWFLWHLRGAWVTECSLVPALILLSWLLNILFCIFGWSQIWLGQLRGTYAKLAKLIRPRIRTNQVKFSRRPYLI